MKNLGFYSVSNPRDYYDENRPVFSLGEGKLRLCPYLTKEMVEGTIKPPDTLKNLLSDGLSKDPAPGKKPKLVELAQEKAITVIQNFTKRSGLVGAEFLTGPTRPAGCIYAVLFENQAQQDRAHQLYKDDLGSVSASKHEDDGKHYVTFTSWKFTSTFSYLQKYFSAAAGSGGSGSGGSSSGQPDAKKKKPSRSNPYLDLLREVGIESIPYTNGPKGALYAVLVDLPADNDALEKIKNHKLIVKEGIVVETKEARTKWHIYFFPKGHKYKPSSRGKSNQFLEIARECGMDASVYLGVYKLEDALYAAAAVGQVDQGVVDKIKEHPLVVKNGWVIESKQSRKNWSVQFYPKGHVVEDSGLGGSENGSPKTFSTKKRGKSNDFLAVVRSCGGTQAEGNYASIPEGVEYSVRVPAPVDQNLIDQIKKHQYILQKEVVVDVREAVKFFYIDFTSPEFDPDNQQEPTQPASKPNPVDEDSQEGLDRIEQVAQRLEEVADQIHLSKLCLKSVLSELYDDLEKDGYVVNTLSGHKVEQGKVVPVLPVVMSKEEFVKRALKKKKE
jgi:hypothetical protein